MRISILRIGSVERKILEGIQEGLSVPFPGVACEITGSLMPIPEDAYDTSRNQFHSSHILTKILDYIEPGADRVLGVTEVDLFVPRLNFVFGEAECPGRSAIISLLRLKPEFYEEPSDWSVFSERSAKEAVHEIGHTLGLKHCRNSECIMFFSNNIEMTDKKKNKFCEKCSEKVNRALKRL